MPLIVQSAPPSRWISAARRLGFTKKVAAAAEDGRRTESMTFHIVLYKAATAEPHLMPLAKAAAAVASKRVREARIKNQVGEK